MEVSEVCDRAEIRLLMDRYALACDSGDWKAFRELFTADCVCDYTEFGGSRADLETTVAWLSNGLSLSPAGSSRTRESLRRAAILAITSSSASTPAIRPRGRATESRTVSSRITTFSV